MDAVKIEGGFRWAAVAGGPGHHVAAGGGAHGAMQRPGRWLQVGTSIAHVWHHKCPSRPPPHPSCCPYPWPPTCCSNRVKAVRSVVEAGVAVMGHVGLTPQAISVLGGFRPAAQSGAVCACLVAAV